MRGRATGKANWVELLSGVNLKVAMLRSGGAVAAFPSMKPGPGYRRSASAAATTLRPSAQTFLRCTCSRELRFVFAFGWLLAASWLFVLSFGFRNFQQGATSQSSYPGGYLLFCHHRKSFTKYCASTSLGEFGRPGLAELSPSQAKPSPREAMPFLPSHCWVVPLLFHRLQRF